MPAVLPRHDHAADADHRERLRSHFDIGHDEPDRGDQAPAAVAQPRVLGLRPPLGRVVTDAEGIVLAVDELVPLALAEGADALDHRSSGGSGTSCGGRPSSWSQSSKASPSRPTCSLAPPSAIRTHVLLTAVGDEAAHLGRDAGELALAELAHLALDHERERAGEDEIDLFLVVWRWMRPRCPGRRMIWLRPKVVTPSIRRSGTNRSSVSVSSAA